MKNFILLVVAILTMLVVMTILSPKNQNYMLYFPQENKTIRIKRFTLLIGTPCILYEDLNGKQDIMCSNYEIKRVRK